MEERIGHRLAVLIQKGVTVLSTHEPNPPNVIGFPTLDTSRYMEWRSQALALLTRVFGSSHTYTEVFKSKVSDRAYESGAERGLGILRAALEDVDSGDLETLQEMAAAEVFSDFLEQADHLLKNGYLAPAASLAGAVLENGLRSLAKRNGITVKGRDNLQSLNSKVGDKGVYSRLRQQEVAVWIKVRNAADHGCFDDITQNRVADLIAGVRGLLNSAA